ncbi:MAG TPA: maleylpyruvate isomerase N-terminal domain-containing protein [Actinomycetota bacterium]|nr:maleylpyruvate isomerase N-terminal domain-containing protein [Actinomycetota bacterium]
MDPTLAAFQASYDLVGPLLDADALEQRWDDESVLTEFSVRGLAGHLVRVGWAVLDYSRHEVAGDSPIPAEEYYRTVLAAMGAHEHLEVRVRGEEVAGADVGSLRASYHTARDGLGAFLRDADPNRLVKVFRGLVMRFEDYLQTRIVETLVHLEDLALSLGVTPPDPPRAAYDIAIDHLIRVARLTHGDRAVLTALSRRERDDLDALRIF